jgi:hypothetical protein
MGIKGFQGKYGTSNVNGNSSEVTRDEKNISSRGYYVVECNRADGRISPALDSRASGERQWGKQQREHQRAHPDGVGGFACGFRQSTPRGQY